MNASCVQPPLANPSVHYMYTPSPQSTPSLVRLYLLLDCGGCAIVSKSSPTEPIVWARAMSTASGFTRTLQLES